jgi:hypothetical protein
MARAIGDYFAVVDARTNTTEMRNGRPVGLPRQRRGERSKSFAVACIMRGRMWSTAHVALVATCFPRRTAGSTSRSPTKQTDEVL